MRRDSANYDHFVLSSASVVVDVQITHTRHHVDDAILLCESEEEKCKMANE